MNLPPTFILSLDCEGKWGMADVLQPYHHRLLTSTNLASAYKQLLNLLSRFDLAATFAFVMAFALSRKESEHFPVLHASRRGADSWLDHYWACQKLGFDEGWHEPDLLERVRDAGEHEIACHGFCHRPLGEASVDPVAAAAELDAAMVTAKYKGLEVETLVFPRNEVGNLTAVKAAGLLGYRSRLVRPGGPIGRGAALLEEFNVWARPQPAAFPESGLVEIPPGHFFNWRFGMRRLVPPAATRARWRKQLKTCTRKGGVVHLWLHPHNLVSGPDTAAVLADVLAEVARLRDLGQIEVMTQQAYCRRVVGMRE